MFGRFIVHVIFMENKSLWKFTADCIFNIKSLIQEPTSGWWGGGIENNNHKQWKWWCLNLLRYSFWNINWENIGTLSNMQYIFLTHYIIVIVTVFYFILYASSYLETSRTVGQKRGRFHTGVIAKNHHPPLKLLQYNMVSCMTNFSVGLWWVLCI